jgi:hypothetical protein
MVVRKNALLLFLPSLNYSCFMCFPLYLKYLTIFKLFKCELSSLDLKLKHVCLQLRIRNVRLCKTVCSGSDYCFANSYILQLHTRVYKMPSVQFPLTSLLAVQFSSSRTFSLLILVLVPVLIQSVILLLQW